MTRVLIVDDHPLVAETIAVALGRSGVDATVLDPAADDPREALADGAYDFCLLDLDWGQQAFLGVSLIPDVVASGASCLVLTGTVHEPLFGYCLELGAAGIITKQQKFTELVHSIGAVLQGASANSDGDKYRWMLEAHRARDEHRRRLAPFEALTAAECGVLSDLMAGKTVADIADDRYVAVSTIRTHVRQIHQKLCVSSQLAAVALARDAGWSEHMRGVDTDAAPALSTVLPQPRIA